MTIGRDQLRALAVLRYWFGDLEVLAVLEHERGCGSSGAPAPDTGHQLALTIDAPGRFIDPPSRLAARPSRRDAKRP